jgi:hypothetical protein
MDSQRVKQQLRQECLQDISDLERITEKRDWNQNDTYRDGEWTMQPIFM